MTVRALSALSLLLVWSSGCATQMGHDAPNMIGADTTRLDRSLRRAVRGAMVMGTRGMGDMGSMDMPVPPNSTPMRGTPGPFGMIDMGGMFTVVKVRERPTAADEAGWYEHPENTVAQVADPARMHADGVTLPP